MQRGKFLFTLLLVLFLQNQANAQQFPAITTVDRNLYNNYASAIIPESDGGGGCSYPNSFYHQGLMCGQGFHFKDNMVFSVPSGLSITGNPVGLGEGIIFQNSAVDGTAACYVGNGKYMFFSISGCSSCSSNALHYYIIEPNANSNQGKITNGGQIEASGMSDGIELLPVAGTTDQYWLVYYHKGSGKIRVRKCTPSGVSAATEYTANVNTGDNTTYLKANYDFNRLVLTSPSGRYANVFEFDPESGNTIFFKKIIFLNGVDAGETMLSPNGNYLYIGDTHTNNMYQYNLLTNDSPGSFIYNNSPAGDNTGAMAYFGSYIMTGRSYAGWIGGILNPDEPYTTEGFYKMDMIGYGGGFAPCTEAQTKLYFGGTLTPSAIAHPDFAIRPTVVPDYATTDILTPVTKNVLANDLPGVGTSLQIKDVQFAVDYHEPAGRPVKGTLTFNATSGDITFTPNSDYPYANGQQVAISYTAVNNATPPTCATDYLYVTVNLSPAFQSALFSDDVWFFGAAVSGSPGSQGVIFKKNDWGIMEPIDASGVAKVQSYENTLSVSTPACDGSFVFYTQHNIVYNSLHQKMLNGDFVGNSSIADGLAACYMGNNKYWLFSVTDATSSSTPTAALRYYEIDMSGDNGLGQLNVPANSVIEAGGTTVGTSESIELIAKSGTENEYWLIYHYRDSGPPGTSYIKVANVTPSGITPFAFISPAAMNGTRYTYTFKSRVTSATSAILALADPGNGLIHLFQFNPSTGAISYSKNIPAGVGSGNAVYGLEFSPSGKYLYAASWNMDKIVQRNLSDNTTVTLSYTSTVSSGHYGGGMKLAPDGRIYIARAASNYLAVLTNPNSLMTSTNLIQDGFHLSVQSANTLQLSTGLTPPAKDPVGTTTPPTTLPDVGSTTNTMPVTVDVLANDTYHNGTRLYVASAFFTDGDNTKGTVTYDRAAGTVTFVPNPAYNFTDGQKVYITYTAQDNGAPIPMCNKEQLEITVKTSFKPTSTLFSDDVWFFGQNNVNTTGASPGILFKNGGTVVADNSGISKVYSHENSLSVSTPACDGSFVFYTSHDHVFNANHQPMKGGIDPTGDVGKFEGHSSTADGLAACYIGDNKYYLVAVNNAYDGSGNIGLKYYIVDMNGDNGMGELIVPSSNTIENAGVSESVELIAIPGTYDEYWLVYYQLSDKTIRVRRVTPSGIGPVVTTLGSAQGYTTTSTDSRQFKRNSDNTRLALANGSSSKTVDVFGFNPTTGAIALEKRIDMIGKISGFAYGVEFSPNGKYLYITDCCNDAVLFQYDMTTYDMVGSAITYGTTKGGNQYGGGLKLGPDGKIYVARCGTEYVGVINKPDEICTTSGFYTANGLMLSVKNNNGLCLSTGLTPPYLDPTSANQPPVVSNDVATTTHVTAVKINPLLNDTDPDGGQVLHLTGVEFSDPADNNVKGTLSWNAADSTVTFTPSLSYNFNDGEKVYLTYTVRDNGAPVALCSKGTIEITVIKAKLTVTLSDTEVKEGEEITATICMPSGTVAPPGGLSVSLQPQASSTATSADYTFDPVTVTIPAGLTCADIKIQASNDDLVEGNEVLDVKAIATNFTASETATVTIKDQTPGDLEVVKYTPDPGNASEEPLVHGSFLIRFKKTGVTSTKKFKVTFELTGSAQPNTDYQPVTPLEVTFEIGDHQKEVPINVIKNYIVDGNRDVVIKLKTVEYLP